MDGRSHICCPEQVWLPLFADDTASDANIVAKRVMLPFTVDVYPLSVLFEVCAWVCVHVRASVWRVRLGVSLCYVSMCLYVCVHVCVCVCVCVCDVHCSQPGVVR